MPAHTGWNMPQASRSTPHTRRAEFSAFLRLWPLYVLLACVGLVMGTPVWHAARMAWRGGASGGVEVNTSGASGHAAGRRYVLDLPVEIINGGSDMVQGVSLWVESFACPNEAAPTKACRRLTAFEQYVPARVAPGSIESYNQRMEGVAPTKGEVLRIRRKLQSIDDNSTPGNG